MPDRVQQQPQQGIERESSGVGVDVKTHKYFAPTDYQITASNTALCPPAKKVILSLLMYLSLSALYLVQNVYDADGVLELGCLSLCAIVDTSTFCSLGHRPESTFPSAVGSDKSHIYDIKTGLF